MYICLDLTILTCVVELQFCSLFSEHVFVRCRCSIQPVGDKNTKENINWQAQMITFLPQEKNQIGNVTSAFALSLCRWHFGLISTSAHLKRGLGEGFGWWSCAWVKAKEQFLLSWSQPQNPLRVTSEQILLQRQWQRKMSACIGLVGLVQDSESSAGEMSGLIWSLISSWMLSLARMTVLQARCWNKELLKD